jgi:hypothetical protein
MQHNTSLKIYLLVYHFIFVSNSIYIEHVKGSKSALNCINPLRNCIIATGQERKGPVAFLSLRANREAPGGRVCLGHRRRRGSRRIHIHNRRMYRDVHTQAHRINTNINGEREIETDGRRNYRTNYRHA